MTIETARPQKRKFYKEESTMKNIYTHISIAVVTFLMMVASTCLMTAPEAPIREGGGYAALIFGVITVWAITKAMLMERDHEMHNIPHHSHA